MDMIKKKISELAAGKKECEERKTQPHLVVPAVHKQVRALVLDSRAVIRKQRELVLARAAVALVDISERRVEARNRLVIDRAEECTGRVQNAPTMIDNDLEGKCREALLAGRCVAK